MLFLPNDDELAAQAKQIVKDVVAAEGRCTIAGWRDVPVDHSIVGRMAKITEPRIVQVRSSPDGHNRCPAVVHGISEECTAPRLACAEALSLPKADSV